jgi:hypothetical protein
VGINHVWGNGCLIKAVAWSGMVMRLIYAFWNMVEFEREESRMLVDMGSTGSALGRE